MWKYNFFSRKDHHFSARTKKKKNHHHKNKTNRIKKAHEQKPHETDNIAYRYSKSKTLKEGAGFPRGSRGEARSRSSEQNLDQRDSSEAAALNLLLRHATLAVSFGPSPDSITFKAKSPTISKPIIFFLFFGSLPSLSSGEYCCHVGRVRDLWDEEDKDKGCVAFVHTSPWPWVIKPLLLLFYVVSFVWSWAKSCDLTFFSLGLIFLFFFFSFFFLKKEWNCNFVNLKYQNEVLSKYVELEFSPLYFLFTNQ